MSLSATNISFGYKPKQTVLDGFSADFERGATTAITGKSGSGKSTLLYLLGLMVRPRSGNILIDGEPVDRLSDRNRSLMRANEFGFVFQDAALDPTRTVIDNVVETGLYRGEDMSVARERAAQMLIEFGVENRGDHKPGEISGGQAQRIALCRALLGNPRFLLADEPTGNLDAETEQVVFKALQDHATSGATVIIVTHSEHLAQACDRRVRI